MSQGKVQEELLRVEGLSKFFPVSAGIFGKTVGQVRAVDDLSFTLYRGETLGVVGESGCGKTTVGRSLLRLIEPTAGRVVFDGVDITALSQGQMRPYRRRMQIVFQDPFGSLNPRKRVVQLVGEAIEQHGIAKGKDVEQKVEQLLEQVGLPASWLHRYPHEFSGGQRQRIGIARALALSPDLIVCDEAVSALDVSIQAQVINLLIDLRKKLNLAYLFIAHDLSVVRHISDRVVVMYLGKLVELSPCEPLFERPGHPYTRALLSAIPRPDPTAKHQRVILQGDVPTPLNPPPGCHFHTRCPHVMDRCLQERPPLYPLPEGRQSRCFHVEGLSDRKDWFDVFEERLRKSPSPSAGKRPSKTGYRAAARVSDKRHEIAAVDAAFFENLEALGRVGFGVLVVGACGVVAMGSLALGVGLAVVGILMGLWFHEEGRGAGTGLSFRSKSRWALAGLAVSFLFSELSQPLRHIETARRQLAILEHEIEGYTENTGRPPQDWAELRFRTAVRFGAGAPRDPWGRAYVYQPSPLGTPSQPSSLGADGVVSSDDIKLP